MTIDELAKVVYGKVCAEVGRGGSAVQVPIIAEAIRAAVAEEREACARLAQQYYLESEGDDLAAAGLADAIRARGKP